MSGWSLFRLIWRLNLDLPTIKTLLFVSVRQRLVMVSWKSWLIECLLEKRFTLNRYRKSILTSTQNKDFCLSLIFDMMIFNPVILVPPIASLITLCLISYEESDYWLPFEVNSTVQIIRIPSFFIYIFRLVKLSWFFITNSKVQTTPEDLYQQNQKLLSKV